MMTNFMDENFLLENKTAKTLYFTYAEKMPIIDYHCHVSPKEIAENRRFDNIAQVWLGGDHYKWRLIRSCGVKEEFITSNTSSDREKFQKFAECLPHAIGNPLYHWTHLELQRYFGITKPLNGNTAEEIWQICNAKLASEELSVQGIIKNSNVKVICTTDDPADDLRYHMQIAAEGKCSAKVYPAMRPDATLRIERTQEYPLYMQRLAQVAGLKIKCMADIREALHRRIEFFHSLGCRVSDHALEYMFYEEASEAELNTIVLKGLAGEKLTTQEIEKYKSALLLFLSEEYHRLDWGMQLHYGALRDNSSLNFAKLGPDTGFDSMGTYNNAIGLSKLLNAMEKAGHLPKTILYSLNPTDNAMLGSIIGCFQGPEARCKLQQGSAWWFNDSKAGIEAQLESIANLSVLGNILGMLTDSRSFLSYTRHEYYRRILCNWLGRLVERGEYPADIDFLGQTVQNICYNNVKNYFGF